MPIGSLDEAAVIAPFATVDSYRVEDGLIALPEGWTFLGSGCSRTAYLSPSGVAYKVPRNNYGSDYNLEQDREYLSFVHLTQQEMPEGWDVPETYRYRVPQGNKEVVIIAMEAFDDMDHDAYRALDLSVARSFFGLTDTHSGNIRIREDGTAVVIDLGYSDLFGGFSNSLDPTLSEDY